MNTSLYKNTQLYIKANLIDLSDLVPIAKTRSSKLENAGLKLYTAVVYADKRHTGSDDDGRCFWFGSE